MTAASAEPYLDATAKPPLAPSFITGIRYGLRSRLATFPWYIRLARNSRHRDEVVRRDSQVVIDGFPRSANTFASIAFQTAQPRPVTIAHHLHAAAQLIAGVRLGIPTLVLVREPVDAVLSEAIRAYPVPLEDVLRAYCRLYEAVAPYLEEIVVGEFCTVTTDFGSVIRALNRRFGSNFGVFTHSDENVGSVFRLIEERERRRAVKIVDHYLAGRTTLNQVWVTLHDIDRRGVPFALHERAVPRPSPKRGTVKAELMRQLGQPAMSTLLYRAQRAYERVAMYAA